MNRKRHLSLILVLALMCSLILSPMSVTAKKKAKLPVKLKKDSISVRIAKTKKITMQNTKKKVKWSIYTGKKYIKLKSKKAQTVKVYGKTKGYAVIKAKVGKKLFFCTVTVKRRQWKCRYCGYKNTRNYCAYCGAPRVINGDYYYDDDYYDDDDDPDYTTEPDYTATPSASPTPEAAYTDFSGKYLRMSANGYGFRVDLYANQAAESFYSVIARGAISYNMQDLNGCEKYTYISENYGSYPADDTVVRQGEVYLYGSNVLKIAYADHDTGLYGTKIGMIADGTAVFLPTALTVDAAKVQFSLY